MRKSTDDGEKAEVKIRVESTCQYLGFIDDPGSCTTYPIRGHLCHRVKIPTHVRQSYQAEFCLTAVFRKCPVYQENWKGILPANIRAKKVQKTKRLW